MVPRGRRAPIDPESGALSIGLPIADTDSRVIRVEDSADAEPGQQGEILTRGPAVTPGSSSAWKAEALPLSYRRAPEGA